MRRERGSVTILMAGVLVFASLVMVGTVRLGTAAHLRAQATTAADAAALAAADMLALRRGAGTAKSAATETASKNGAQLVECDCAGNHAEVEVVVKRKQFVVHARARAEVDFSANNAQRDPK